MKSRFVFGGLLVALGLAAAWLPIFVFTPCSDDPDHGMRCVFAARAMIGLGSAVALGGALMIGQFHTNAECAGAATVLVMIAMLMPWMAFGLIGLCKMETMACHTATKPAVCILSVLNLLTAAFAAFWFAGAAGKDEVHAHDAA